MKLPPRSKIVIGWDVRGWMNKEQAVAVLQVCDDQIEWLDFCEKFRFPQFEPLTLSSLINPVFNGDTPLGITDFPEIIVAIDAPLAFSSDFCALVEGTPQFLEPPKSEIDNKLAYRDCERWVREQFNKKPLSASFDKLGNNASLAISLARGLKTEGFSLVPQDGTPSARSIIEVYPGLTKKGMGRHHAFISSLAPYMPIQFEPGTDIYDAAICAVLGAVYSGWGRALNIPPLVQPIADYDLTEGWIFCLPPDYVKTFQEVREA